MHPTIIVGLLGMPRWRSFFEGGSTRTGDSLLLLLLVVGVAVLVEALLLVRGLASLPSKGEVQELSENAR